MSFFNRQGIPEVMVRHYTDHDTDKDSEDQEEDSSVKCLVEEDVDFEEDIAVLRAFSLVGVTEREEEFEMHGLVQRATRKWLKSNDAERKWHRIFIQAMAWEFPTGEFENWAKCQMLFPHVFPEIEHGSSEHRNNNDLAVLFDNAGWYALRQGLFAQAESMVSKALNTRKEVLDADDPNIFYSASFFGTIFGDMGRYSEAESMLRQTLATREKVLGVEHPATLSTTNNLALVLDNQDKYSEAESMHRQTLAMRNKVLSVEHPDTLTSMNNLAGMLDRQAKYSNERVLPRSTSYESALL
jgi:tetratricopeptide (TPR) repeat protein